LRRMLRRLVTHARTLGVERPVTGELVEATVDAMGDAYPELAANKAFILQVAASEEERFGATYRQGIQLFTSEVEAQKAEGGGSSVFPGDAAFRLHDTYGFPIESTIELAAEEGLIVDTDRFARLMEEQRTRAREARKKGGEADETGADEALADLASVTGPSEFLGYERL